eukprot:8205062-Pyramimonas_sp.AAC.1
MPAFRAGAPSAEAVQRASARHGVDTERGRDEIEVPDWGCPAPERQGVLHGRFPGPDHVNRPAPQVPPRD